MNFDNDGLLELVRNSNIIDNFICIKNTYDGWYKVNEYNIWVPVKLISYDIKLAIDELCREKLRDKILSIDQFLHIKNKYMIVHKINQFIEKLSYLCKFNIDRYKYYSVIYKNGIYDINKCMFRIPSKNEHYIIHYDSRMYEEPNKEDIGEAYKFFREYFSSDEDTNYFLDGVSKLFHSSFESYHLSKSEISKECTLILVGDGANGKSTIVKLLSDVFIGAIYNRCNYFHNNNLILGCILFDEVNLDKSYMTQPVGINSLRHNSSVYHYNDISIIRKIIVTDDQLKANEYKDQCTVINFPYKFINHPVNKNEKKLVYDNIEFPKYDAVLELIMNITNKGKTIKSAK